MDRHLWWGSICTKCTTGHHDMRPRSGAYHPQYTDQDDRGLYTCLTFGISFFGMRHTPEEHGIERTKNIILVIDYIQFFSWWVSVNLFLLSIAQTKKRGFHRAFINALLSNKNKTQFCCFPSLGFLFNANGQASSRCDILL